MNSLTTRSLPTQPVMTSAIITNNITAKERNPIMVFSFQSLLSLKISRNFFIRQSSCILNKITSVNSTTVGYYFMASMFNFLNSFSNLTICCFSLSSKTSKRFSFNCSSFILSVLSLCFLIALI